jgi:hypothetical protein
MRKNKKKYISYKKYFNKIIELGLFFVELLSCLFTLVIFFVDSFIMLLAPLFTFVILYEKCLNEILNEILELVIFFVDSFIMLLASLFTFVVLFFFFLYVYFFCGEKVFCAACVWFVWILWWYFDEN